MVTLSMQYKELDVVDSTGVPNKVETLTMQQIKNQYPDEWVLVGNPDLSNPHMTGSIKKRLITGVVLYHSKDKRALGYNAKFVTSDYLTITIIFTGEVPKNRKFWL